MKKQQTFKLEKSSNERYYCFEIWDKCDKRGYTMEIKASSFKEAENQCIDFYCYALDCTEEAISVRLIN